MDVTVQNWSGPERNKSGKSFSKIVLLYFIRVYQICRYFKKRLAYNLFYFQYPVTFCIPRSQKQLTYE